MCSNCPRVAKHGPVGCAQGGDCRGPDQLSESEYMCWYMLLGGCCEGVLEVMRGPVVCRPARA